MVEGIDVKLPGLITRLIIRNLSGDKVFIDEKHLEWVVATLV